MKLHAMFASVLVAALCSEHAAAQGMLARAVKAIPSANLVQQVARGATATTVSTGGKAASDTPRRLILKQCGSLQDGYLEALAEANNLRVEDIALDAPLSEDARSPKVYPACLYVLRSETGKIEIRVKKGDDAATLFTRLTGRPAEDRELVAYFGMPLNKLADLQPGQVLEVDYVTAPVWIPTKGSAEELAAIIDEAPAAKAVTNPGGHIIVPEEAKPSIARTGEPCIPNQALFDASALELALRDARARAPTTTAADVMIVDNGFLGADPSKTDPFEGSAFKLAYFEGDPDATIARPYNFVESRLPLIRPPENVGPETYAHGTHVAGLLIGGTGFPTKGQDRAQILANTMRITVMNVADGYAEPFAGAEGFLQSQLVGADWIVNMSLAYYGAGKDAKDIGATFDALVRLNPNSLFVVAAGNDSKDALAYRVFPAMLGGEMHQNLISVAAIGGNGRIADFSNRGESVDVAAPGCQLESWVDNAGATMRLSGTSQAAPVVTFAAALIRHLRPDATPDEIKARIIASGTLLPIEDRPLTAYGVALNAVTAMYVFDDYVQLIGSDTAYLGKIERIDGLSCPKGRDVGSQPLGHLWAVKRAGARVLLYPGRDFGKIRHPCEGDVDPNAAVVMRPTRVVRRHEVTNWDGEAEMIFPMNLVSNIVPASTSD